MKNRETVHRLKWISELCHIYVSVCVAAGEGGGKYSLEFLPQNFPLNWLSITSTMERVSSESLVFSGATHIQRL